MTTMTQNQRLGIEVEQQGRVLLARLHGGPRGEFGPEIAADLEALVTRAETDDGVGAVLVVEGVVKEKLEDGCVRVDLTATSDGVRVLGQARAVVRLA